MNFLQIAQFVVDQQDGDRPATVYNASLDALPQETRRLRENINRAYTLVKLALGARNESAETTFTINTQTGVDNYAIPAGVLSVTELIVGSGPPIKILDSWFEFERARSDAIVQVSTGQPSLATIFQRRVYFYPVPDIGYTVSGRGIETLTELNLDTDTPDLPAEMHRVIAEFALYFEMVYENNPAAGALIVQESGSMQAQGGQAANAMNMFNMIKRGLRQHWGSPPRMIGPDEWALTDLKRRIIRG